MPYEAGMKVIARVKGCNVFEDSNGKKMVQLNVKSIDQEERDNCRYEIWEAFEDGDFSSEIRELVSETLSRSFTRDLNLLMGYRVSQQAIDALGQIGMWFTTKEAAEKLKRRDFPFDPRSKFQPNSQHQFNRSKTVRVIEGKVCEL